MTDRDPTETTNIDRYGNPTLPWSRPREILAIGSQGPAVTFFLGTVDGSGKPHAAGVGAVWYDGDLYFNSGLGTHKARDLAARPACTISARLPGIDVVFDGEAHVVDDPGLVAKVAEVFRAGGWPVEVEGSLFVGPYSAPSAGPPPWSLFRVAFDQVVGVATAEPYGATRWRFGPSVAST